MNKTIILQYSRILINRHIIYALNAPLTKIKTSNTFIPIVHDFYFQTLLNNNSYL